MGCQWSPATWVGCRKLWSTGSQDIWRLWAIRRRWRSTRSTFFPTARCVKLFPGQPARQWNLIQKLRPKAIVGVPSFLQRLAIWGEENGINTRKCGIESLITIGEPIRSPDYSPTPLGKQLEDAWGAKIYSSYGATEFETAFCECSASCGGHVHPELMIVEIVDDEGKPMPDGLSGEVIVTPLGVEGFPLVRFRTGDIARLDGTPCPGGK